MSSSESLQALRRQIDSIDDQLHDLIMARCALVESIAAAKEADPIALRPGREAEILRRLLERHSGPFPKGALVRIWRELISALTGLQAQLTVAVAGEGLMELARNHFGVVCAMVAGASAGQVVKLVDEGKATVGVLPLPSCPAPEAVPGDQPVAAPWWTSLLADRPDMPRVIVRLPTYPAAGDGPEVLVIARRFPDDTGHDRTLLVIEAATQVSRDRVRALMAAAGLELLATLGCHLAPSGNSLHLLEVDGWLDAADPRLGQLVGEPIAHAVVIGGYPVPLSP